MRAQRHWSDLTIALLAVNMLIIGVFTLPTGCASVGTGDAVVVRAEDVLVNSLSFFDTAQTWHEANSTKESPQLYKLMTALRNDFPPAWKTLDASIKVYKATKTDVAQKNLVDALGVVQKLVNDVKALWAPGVK